MILHEVVEHLRFICSGGSFDGSTRHVLSAICIHVIMHQTIKLLEQTNVHLDAEKAWFHSSVHPLYKHFSMESHPEVCKPKNISINQEH